MKKYRVVFVFAPRPFVEFGTLEQAKEFAAHQIALVEIQRRTIFGEWKKI